MGRTVYEVNLVEYKYDKGKKKPSRIIFHSTDSKKVYSYDDELFYKRFKSPVELQTGDRFFSHRGTIKPYSRGGRNKN